MSKSLFILAPVFFLLIFSDPNSVMAQNKGRRYSSPSRSTLPSQLNYFRNDVGLLDQYNTIVNPANRLESRLGAIERGSGNKKGLADLSKEVDSLRNAQQALGIAPTGTAATFGNLSHYYPSSARSSSPR